MLSQHKQNTSKIACEANLIEPKWHTNPETSHSFLKQQK